MRQNTLEIMHLDAVGSQQETAWKTDIHSCNAKSLSFKLDAGAKVTAVSGETIKEWTSQPISRSQKRFSACMHVDQIENH